MPCHNVVISQIMIIMSIFTFSCTTSTEWKNGTGRNVKSVMCCILEHSTYGICTARQLSKFSQHTIWYTIQTMSTYSSDKHVQIRHYSPPPFVCLAALVQSVTALDRGGVASSQHRANNVKGNEAPVWPLIGTQSSGGVMLEAGRGRLKRISCTLLLI